MSDHPENHQDQTGVALAALVSCIVKTLGELNPPFLPLFEKNLEGTYYEIRDCGVSHLGALETLKSVKDLLKS